MPCRLFEQKIAGEKTEDAFAALAEKYSADSASIGEESETGGGLYEDIAKGQMVGPFENWVYDSAREPGDVSIVKTSYGWHIMYFVSRHEDPEWVESIRSSITEDLLKEYEDGLTKETENTATTTAFTKYAGDEALKLVKKLYVSQAEQ